MNLGVKMGVGMVAEVEARTVVEVVVSMREGVRLSWNVKRVWFCLSQGDKLCLWRVRFSL